MKLIQGHEDNQYHNKAPGASSLSIHHMIKATSTKAVKIINHIILQGGSLFYPSLSNIMEDHYHHYLKMHHHQAKINGMHPKLIIIPTSYPWKYVITTDVNMRVIRYDGNTYHHTLYPWYGVTKVNLEMPSMCCLLHPYKQVFKICKEQGLCSFVEFLDEDKIFKTKSSSKYYEA